MIKPFISVAVGTLLLTACAAAETDYEAMYLARFEAIKANRGMMPEYSPMESVAGASHYQPLAQAADNELSVSQQALDEADQYAANNNSTAFMVWRDGKIQRASYYDGADSTTPIVSKSLSKPLGAIAVGRAIQLGHIDSIEQSAADFITEWQGTPKAAVKIKHLLNMTSGFLPQGYSTDPMHPWNTAYLSYEHDKVLIHDYPLQSEPGSTYGYNNAAADMIAIILERATGERYSDFLSTQILSPIGAAGGEIWVNRVGGLAHSGCCMKLPAETWLRLAILLLEDGKIAGQRLLPEGYVTLMRTPSSHNEHYGLGVWVGTPYQERRGFTGSLGPGPKVLHSAPYADPELFLFDGNSNQVVYVSPATRTVILRLGQTPPKTPEWDNSILPNLILKGLR